MSMRKPDAPIIQRQSGNVVSLAAVRAGNVLTVEEAWERFVTAQHLSKSSLDLTDAISAGRAYGDFLELFTKRRG
jgi:hypothetical protein